MGNVSRGLIGLLVATVAVFAIVFILLKPGSSNNGSTGTSSFQSDINAAKGVQTTVNKNAAAAVGNTTSTAASTTAGATSTTAHTTTTATTKTPSHAKARSSGPATPAARLSTVQNALKAHKVVAMLFYNPAAPDDKVVKAELASISSHNGQVVKLSIPLTELPSYTLVITQVPVNFSPTLVIIDRHQQAEEIQGFADGYEIAQRIDNAL